MRRIVARVTKAGSVASATTQAAWPATSRRSSIRWRAGSISGGFGIWPDGADPKSRFNVGAARSPPAPQAYAQPIPYLQSHKGHRGVKGSDPNTLRRASPRDDEARHNQDHDENQQPDDGSANNAQRKQSGYKRSHRFPTLS